MLWIVTAIALLFLWIQMRNLRRAHKKMYAKNAAATEKQIKLLHSLLSKENYLPPQLLPIKRANAHLKILSLPEVDRPYNGTLALEESGYRLFFRYDTPLRDNTIHSHIATVALDNHFHPRDSITLLQTKSPYSEDPRYFTNHEQNFLLYNDCLNRNQKRRLKLATLDPQNHSILLLREFPSKHTEKNWTPFTHNGQTHFIHTIYPPRILRLSPTHAFEIPTHTTQEPAWVSRWGDLRGGTPAILIGDEYLAFFHSRFEDPFGIAWYCMGAYTFQAKPPFTLKRISKEPIMLPEAYALPLHPLSNPSQRSIYPAGLIYKEDHFHVSCGINDSAIGIITFQKQTLLSGLIDLH